MDYVEEMLSIYGSVETLFNYQDMKKQAKLERKLYTFLDPPPRFYETNDGSSITNQDTGPSLQELIAMHARGEEIDMHDVHYDDDEDTLMKSGDFDLSDISEAKDTIDSFAQVSAPQAPFPPADGDDEGSGATELGAGSGTGTGEAGDTNK